MVVKRIVCLANSRRPSGNCFAGIEMLPTGGFGSWIRPINGATMAISDEEQQYADGQYPRLLDIVEVPLLEPAAQHHQSENWLIAPGRWRKVGTLDWSDLAQLEDSAAPLWVNGYSTQDGNNNQVPTYIAHTQSDSLRLIHLETLDIAVVSGRRRRVEGLRYWTDKHLQARFVYDGDQYWIWITDPQYERRYCLYPYGSYTIAECFVTVSLAENYHGHCHKLIAGIMERP